MKNLILRLSKAQQEALADLLLLAIYKDNKISQQETQIFDLVEFTFPISVYLQSATARIRAIVKDERKVEELLNDIAIRLKEDQSKIYCFRLVNQLIQSDGLTEIENSFLAQVEKALSIA